MFEASNNRWKVGVELYYKIQILVKNYFKASYFNYLSKNFETCLQSDQKGIYFITLGGVIWQYPTDDRFNQ